MNLFIYVLTFCSHLKMAVRVKICGIDTVNSTLGMEWGVGNELTGSEFKLGYIKFALSSWVQRTRREANNSLPPTAEDKNGWDCTSTYSILKSSKIHFMLDRTINYGQPHYTAFCLSALICRMNSSMGAN